MPGVKTPEWLSRESPESPELFFHNNLVLFCCIFGYFLAHCQCFECHTLGRYEIYFLTTPGGEGKGIGLA